MGQKNNTRHKMYFCLIPVDHYLSAYGKSHFFSELSPSLKDEIAKFVEKLVDARIHQENTAVLQRIETLTLQLHHQRKIMKQGFEMTDKRFEDMKHYSDKRFNTVQWMIGIGFTAIAILMALFILREITHPLTTLSTLPS